MAKNDFITGLDIGTTKVCALIAEVSEAGVLVVKGFGESPSEGIKKGVVVDIESTAHAIEIAVSKASHQASCEVDSVYVGITGEHIYSVNSTAAIAIADPHHDITDADVQRVIEASKIIVLPPDRQIVHTIPRSFIVDGQGSIKQPVGMSATRLEVETHIVHGLTTFIQNVEKCVTRAGLDVAEAILEPIATAASVLLPTEKELGVCLIDIGGGTTDIAVFIHGEIFFSAVIPVGGVQVTNDVAYGLRMDTEDAEQLKIERGCALNDLVGENELISVKQLGRSKPKDVSRRELVSIIHSRIQELFQLVRNEIQNAHCLDNILAGVVISGGGSRLEGCQQIAEQVFDLPVRIGTPAGLSGLGAGLNQTRYATVIGLVQIGIYRRNILRNSRSISPLWRGITHVFSSIRDFFSV